MKKKIVNSVKTCTLGLLQTEHSGIGFNPFVNASHTDAERHYFGKDHLGSVRAVTNQWGSPLRTYDYDVFGQPLQDRPERFHYGFTGKEYDSWTGLYNYGFRDYSATFGRFTTVDPIQDGCNWYAYVNSDPVSWLDPWGLEPCKQESGQDVTIEAGPSGGGPYINGIYTGDFNPDRKERNPVIGPKLPLAEVRNGVATPLGTDYSYLESVTSEFGPDRPSFKTNNGEETLSGHNGMDFGAPIGTRINSAMAGEVTYVDDKGNGSYGKVVIIKHDNGTYTLYAHQSVIYVNVGNTVEAGEHIGNVGKTGKVTGPHLHFGFDGNGDGEFKKDDMMDDPARLLFSGEAPEE